jgi:hypothetical protein
MRTVTLTLSETDLDLVINAVAYMKNELKSGAELITVYQDPDPLRHQADVRSSEEFLQRSISYARLEDFFSGLELELVVPYAAAR